MYVCVCVYTYVCMYVMAWITVPMNPSSYISDMINSIPGVYVRVYLNMCVYVCTYVCMHVCHGMDHSTYESLFLYFRYD